MEVHHHPDLHHKSKNFKEYFLEFLMIFLAVTMGFFAESYRESIVNHAKEQDYIKSMITDLRADTAESAKTIKSYKIMGKEVDTMLMCLKSDNPDPSIINRFVSQEFWEYTGFSYNDRTLEQLRNSGNFRLIRNKAVADSILAYDDMMKAYVINQYDDLKITLFSYKDAEARVIPYSELKLPNTKGFDSSDFKKTDKPTFITEDKELIAFYYNKLFIHEALCQTFVHTLTLSHKMATRLINFIEKEYKLE